jgi:hypothetical protein
VGLTTESLHLFTAGNSAHSLDSLAAALRPLLAAAGYQESPGATDRVLVLVPSPPWLSLYDTDPGALPPLALALSRSLSADLALLGINDSSAYSARLCRSGKWVDTLRGGALNRRPAGQPELWAAVLPTANPAELTQALRSPSPFAEQPLRQLCLALGLPASAALLLPEELSDQPPAGAVVLRFRAAQPAAAPAAPLLTLLQAPAPPPAAVGQLVSQLVATVANDGPTAQGLRVTLRGAALTQGLIEPRELHVVSIVALGGGLMGNRQTFPLTPDAPGQEGHRWTALLPDLQLQHRVDPRTLPAGAGANKAAKDYHRRPVHFHLSALALAPGAATLSLRLEWLNGPGAPLEVHLPFTITAPA